MKYPLLNELETSFGDSEPNKTLNAIRNAMSNGLVQGADGKAYWKPFAYLTMFGVVTDTAIDKIGIGSVYDHLHCPLGLMVYDLLITAAVVAGTNSKEFEDDRELLVNFINEVEKHIDNDQNYNDHPALAEDLLAKFYYG